jgi:hypothetical protein
MHSNVTENTAIFEWIFSNFWMNAQQYVTENTAIIEWIFSDFWMNAQQ